MRNSSLRSNTHHPHTSRDTHRPVVKRNVYTDGSTNHGQGIAGGWLVGGMSPSGRASLAGEWIGAETSELLGIVGSLALLYASRQDT